MVLLVFSHQQSLCTWSLPRLYEHDTLQAKCGGRHSIPQIFISEGPKSVKPKSKLTTKTGLAEEGDITIRGVIKRIFVFRTNRGTWLLNFIRRSLVRRTYNTKPSSKELAWGRSTPVYPGKYSFPFVLVLVSSNSLKNDEGETK